MTNNSFVNRHIGPQDDDIKEMVSFLKYSTLDELGKTVVPSDIYDDSKLDICDPVSEFAILKELKDIAGKNEVFSNFIGMGYHGCITPAVIQRNILENPGWYTQYTPYQPEISQGRLEALLNFQTMISDLTGLEVSNASLLDEATAAAEAMAICFALKKKDTGLPFFVSENCHPQTIEVVKTRSEPLGIEVIVGNSDTLSSLSSAFAVLLQNPGTDGSIADYTELINELQKKNILVIIAVDLLSLTLVKSPGEMGADIAVGSSQRFGVPMGFGGPHAAFLATRDQYKRKIPGRIVGLSKDASGKPAARLAIQTREQHIRRDKATSNICTAQVLLAIMAGMYAVYHGPGGLKNIAAAICKKLRVLRDCLVKLKFDVNPGFIFDTLWIKIDEAGKDEILLKAKSEKINLRVLNNQILSISFDEVTSEHDIKRLIYVLSGEHFCSDDIANNVNDAELDIPDSLIRKSDYLLHPVFHNYRSETEMLRYIRRLEGRDLSLCTAMIPLGSCTMKLNATTEMVPVTWETFSNIHPYADSIQSEGYKILISELESMLAELTGFDKISLQPNAGSQGEYAGLLVIRKYFKKSGEHHRNICLIPKSAHGTNPASAIMAGFKVVVVDCDDSGNVSIDDLTRKATEHKSNLAALMITYPSTHGVFESGIKEICRIVHENGGQVYMDGANLNAQIGLCKPGKFGPDLCHINLHKTFCIPHGGGGPGIGPIGVKSHLSAFLPSHPFFTDYGKSDGIGPVAAAPWGSAGILPVSWVYIRMMGASGLRKATLVAILNANYIAKKLDPYFPVLYKGNKGLVAHECIIDLRLIKAQTGIDVEDVAKRLMDYGFHAPTVSFPVPGTLMVEPTESESKKELDRFCDAMISIRTEIAEIENGNTDKTNNVLKNAPHTAMDITDEKWNRPYSKKKAVFPSEWTRENKFWPSVNRIDGVHGDRHLICSCPPIDSY